MSTNKSYCLELCCLSFGLNFFLREASCSTTSFKEAIAIREANRKEEGYKEEQCGLVFLLRNEPYRQRKDNPQLTIAAWRDWWIS